MISERAKKIHPSPTLSITAKAKEMKEKGIDVISFGAGEPDFDTPDYIKNAAIEAIRKGFTKYTATSGIMELKQAICFKFKEDNDLLFSPAEILVSTGAKQCLYNLLQVLIDPSDEVLIPPPYWASYEEMVTLAGGICIFPATKNFKIVPEKLAEKITSKTKVLILNSPGNPSGAVYETQELQKIAEICVKNGIYIISDEIYEKIIYEKVHVSIASLGNEIKKITFVVNGFSKAYSMTGWRIGYCAGDETVIKTATNLQDHSTSNTSSISQKAALEALLNKAESDKFIGMMKKEFEQRRNYIILKFGEIEEVEVKTPDGAFYAFPDVSKLYTKDLKNSLEFSKMLLEKAHIAVVPGSAFGDDDRIRLSYATNMKNIEAGMNRLIETIQKLKG